MDPVPEIEGNISPDEFAELHSVGFILVGEDYHFFHEPGRAVTSISGIDSDNGIAYGWSRATADPATANERGFVLDLRENSFRPLRAPNVDRTIVRGFRHGKVLGMAALRATGEAFGFLFDTQADEWTEVRRPGYTHGSLTDLNASGVMVGYNDFGLEGFVHRNGHFEPLEGDGAGRLFPTGINDEGRIVGLWGEPDRPWDRSSGFVADPAGDGYDVAPFRVTGNRITVLSGINNDGTIAGMYHPDGPDSTARVFTMDGPEGAPYTLLTSDPNLDPWVVGITDGGIVYGAVTVMHAPQDPEECGGHGHLHGTQCHCDSGFRQDPDDPGMCIPD